MAQKRNPISLRLQTRLKGKEKRFALSWYTDHFFSQLFAQDVRTRLYVRDLLNFGGSWAAGSRLPETCVSTNLFYRRSCVVSVVLDRRSEEYQTNAFLQSKSRTTASSKVYSLPPVNNQIVPLFNPRGENKESVSKLYFDLDTGVQKSFFFKSLKSNTEKLYFLFSSLVEKNTKKQKRFCTVGESHFCIQNDAKKRSNRGAQSAPLRTEVDSRSYVSKQNSFHDRSRSSLCNPFFTNSQQNRCFADKKGEYTKHVSISIIESFLRLVHKSDRFSCNTTKKHKTILSKTPFTQSFFLADTNFTSNHFTSVHLVKAVSIPQNVEFCIYSIALLCRKRYAFNRIKEYLFSRLHANQMVCGARLLCSGRMGGRSKSAMRAQKQSAYFGKTPISIFSSRLAFASTDVDTSFGKVGIKLWICYK